MPILVSLAEASSYLGVSKATLRNWDREGKLKAHRHPINQYRAYDMDELRVLRTQTSLLDEIDPTKGKSSVNDISDVRAAKRVVSRLHNALRNTDSDSSLVERFDELTKLLFLKLATGKEADNLFAVKTNENSNQYANRIRDCYSEVANANSNLISKKFTKLNCSKDAITQCGTILASVSFESANFDVKGVAYEEVIRGTFDKSDHQQFFTPHQVVTFMTEMVRPFLKGEIMDPACGTAGFLAEVARSSADYKKLTGIEIDERLAWVSGINLLLHGAKNFETHCLSDGGTLGANASPFMSRADVILTNPPFGSDFSDQDALNTFVLGEGRTSRRRGILFLERCHALLKKNGVMGIVIDEGVLNLPTAIDVRHVLIRHLSCSAIRCC